MLRHPQEIFKETQASKFGDAPVHPLLHQQSSVRPSSHYIFIASHDMCCSWSVFAFILVFCFFFWSLQCWTLACLIGRDTRSALSQNTLELHLYPLNVKFIYCLFVSSCSSLRSCLRAINFFCRKFRTLVLHLYLFRELFLLHWFTCLMV